MPTRRRFVRTACGAVLLSDLVTIGGCGSPEVKDLGDDDDAATSPVPTITPNGNLVAFSLTEYPQLENIEGVAFGFVATPPLTVIVVRTSDTTFIAVNGLCTHRNCYVAYQATTDDFNCGCHGARFAQDGSVTQGPASAPLTAFPATFDGAIVTVDITGA